jgi:hypothetical protein
VQVVEGYSGDVLVRFDKEYPWGDEHDAFKQVCTCRGGDWGGMCTYTIDVLDAV